MLERSVCISLWSFVCVWILGTYCDAFLLPLPRHQQTTRPSRQIALQATHTSDFEYQELRAQLGALQASNVSFRDLPPSAQKELATYTRAVVRHRSSKFPTTQSLISSRWELLYSTQSQSQSSDATGSSASLPNDAAIVIYFHNATHLDYSLQFTMGPILRAITAHSTYAFESATTLTFVYERITMDVLDWKGINIGFFGLLKGRMNTFQTAYWDDYLWVEQVADNTYNVYKRKDLPV
jgi:hypothetical protein